MATSKTYEGVTYSIPAQGELNWFGSTGVDGFLIALAENVPQKTGGTFTLSADLNFGSTAHLKGIFKTTTATPGTTGVLRLANTDTIGWRNAANSANITLAVNASDQLDYSGSQLCFAADTDTYIGRTGANALRVVAGGTTLLDFSSTAITASVAATISTSSGPQITLKDGGTIGTNADIFTAYSDATQAWANVGFLTSNSKDFTIENLTDTGAFIVQTNNVTGISMTYEQNITFGSGSTNVHRINGASQTTVGSAGAASALPAQPTGYLELNINGTARVFPYYAKS